MRTLLLAVLIAGVAIRPSGRVQVWGDDPQLWADAVAHSPQKPRPWINYGRLLALAGRGDDAAAAYRRALELAPPRDRWEGALRTADVARLNLALQAVDQGRYAEALAWTAQIQRRAEGRLSLVTRLEQQWRDEQAQGGSSSAF